MLYTASFFNSKTHRGELVPISRSVPAQFKHLDGKYPLQALLAPSADLLRWWKKQENRHIDMQWDFPNDKAIEQYTDRYREEIASCKVEILPHLLQLDPAKDQTWLRWEPPNIFCHRNLAYKLVEHVRPECCGGQDLKVVEKEEEAIINCDGFALGDRVCLNTAPTHCGKLLEISPERIGAFPQALGIESYAKIEMDNGAIGWWKTIQLTKE